MIVALSTTSARAQITDSLPGYGPSNHGPTFSLFSGYESSRTPEELVRDQDIERRYRETMRTKIPDKKASNDPWRTVRRAPAQPAPDRHRPE